MFSSESAFERKHVRGFRHESESAVLEIDDDETACYVVRTCATDHDVYIVGSSARVSFVAERLNHFAKVKFLIASPMVALPFKRPILTQVVVCPKTMTQNIIAFPRTYPNRKKSTTQQCRIKIGEKPVLKDCSRCISGISC